MYLSNRKQSNSQCIFRFVSSNGSLQTAVLVSGESELLNCQNGTNQNGNQDKVGIMAGF